MGILIPVSEMTIDEIREVRERAITTALTKAGISREIAVIRAVIPGSSTSTDFHDLTYATEATAGQEEWIIDSGALTAGDLKNVISTTSGKQVSQVSDASAMVFYGLVDASGSQDLVALQFQKGAKTVDYWHFQHIYGYPTKVGISKDVVWYGPDDTVKLLFGWRAGATAVTGEDYQWIPLCVIAEPQSKSAAASQ